MSHKNPEITVVIVEDHSIVIEGLSSILQNEEGIAIAGTFPNGEDALAYLQSNRVDVVLLDISLPGMSGIEVCKSIKKMDESIKVIALSNHTEKSMISTMLECGANGYLLKNTSIEELVMAISLAKEDQCPMNEDVRKILFNPIPEPLAIPRLTKREKEILKLVSEGITTAAIASRLFISPQTVETHRRNLMQKFKVSNAVSLIRKAIEHQII